MYKVSQRILDLPISAVRKLSPSAALAKKKGVNVYHLNIGDPDIKTPKVMLNVLRNLNIETIGYAPSAGRQQLLEALKSYYHKLGFMSINEENMLITVGGSEAVAMSLFATTNVGDEVLVLEPFYSNYSALAHLYGVKLAAVPTTIENGFHIPQKDKIEGKLTKKTKAILFCSPNNPTGAIYTRSELQMLVTIAKENDLFLISDEVYREFTFDGKKHVSILDFLDQIPNQVILLDSLSKRFSICGSRVGILASLNKEIMANCSKIAQSRLSAGLVDQLMAERLTKVPASYTKKVVKEYQKRRDLVFTLLSEIDGVFLTKPEGAFYTMVSLPVKNAEDFAIFLLKDFRLNNSTVMLAPGAGFYATHGQGLNQVRIAYVLKVKYLKKAIEIISKGLKAYHSL